MPYVTYIIWIKLIFKYLRRYFPHKFHFVGHQFFHALIGETANSQLVSSMNSLPFSTMDRSEVANVHLAKSLEVFSRVFLEYHSASLCMIFIPFVPSILVSGLQTPDGMFLRSRSFYSKNPVEALMIYLAFICCLFEMFIHFVFVFCFFHVNPLVC